MASKAAPHPSENHVVSGPRCCEFLAVVISDTEPDQILALSFWNNQEDAERYTHEQFPKVNELISHLVESAPVSRAFTVDAFSSHKVRAGKEAA